MPKKGRRLALLLRRRRNSPRPRRLRIIGDIIRITCRRLHRRARTIGTFRRRRRLTRWNRATVTPLQCTRFSISSASTPGSASVEVSPRPSVSLAAILRRMRRMILPLRVFGRPGAHWITSGVAIGPIS